MTDLEKHILRKLTPEEVSPNLTPVLLYRLENNKARITASGVYMIDPKGIPFIITAEHVFSVEDGQVSSAMGAQILRPLDKAPLIAISAVKYKGYHFNGLDICSCSVSENGYPVLKNYSSRKRKRRCFMVVDTQLKNHLGKHVARIRSIISGEFYDVIGAEIDGHTGKVSGICINGKFYPGESGSGFVDEENGSIYILVGGNNETDGCCDAIKKEIRAAYKKKLHGIATLAGPLVHRK